MNEKDARLRGGLKTPEKVANKIHRGKAANKLKKSSPEQPQPTHQGQGGPPSGPDLLTLLEQNEIRRRFRLRVVQIHEIRRRFRLRVVQNHEI